MQTEKRKWDDLQKARALVKPHRSVSELPECLNLLFSEVRQLKNDVKKLKEKLYGQVD